MNPLQQTIRIHKLTLNFGAGKDQNKLEKGVSLIQSLAGKPPVRTITKKRIAAWGLRPGLPVGAKLTLRGTPAQTMLERTLTARDHKLEESCLDPYGNLSFGIKEYIDIQDAQYDPAIGILGLQISVTLCKNGHRVKVRANKPRPIGHRQAITAPEAKAFLEQTYHVSFIP